MAVIQTNYTVAMDSDPINGYPQSRLMTFIKGPGGTVLTTNADGSLNATMAGRGYQEVVLFNLAILDTALHTGTVMSIANLAGNSNIMIDNPSDQTATVSIYAQNVLGKTFLIWSGTVANAGQKILTDADVPLLRTPINKMSINVQYATAPTLGTITATFGGVQA